MPKTEIISEVGINANGDLNTAFRLIDVAASAGCQYVKFQKRDIDLVYTKEELSAPRKSPWGETNGDQKRGLEFDFEQYRAINDYCAHKSINWFFSIWDMNSLKFALNFPDCRFIKLPSALITDTELLRRCHTIGKQVIISTGMSTMAMVDQAVHILGRQNIYCIMHCTSTYPSKPEELNLNCIRTLQTHFPWAKIGFSNHNPGIIFMPMAVALGAEMLEFHITLDRAMYGSDQAASIEPEGVFKLVKHIKNTELAMGDGVKKIYDSEIPIIKKLRRAA